MKFILIFATIMINFNGLMAAESSSIQVKALEFTKTAKKVIQEKNNQVKLLTGNGTILEVNFKNDGTLEDASGKTSNADSFFPGEGLISLEDANSRLKKLGKEPVGEWSLEASATKGWYYDFEGYEANQKMDYLIDAKSGKLLEARRSN